MLHRRAARGSEPDWSSILALLAPEDDYEAVIDGVLARVSELSGRPDAYLYLADAGGLRLHLERSRARPAGDPTRTAPDPMVASQEGGVESMAPTPPLEVLRTEEDEHDREVATPVGRLWSCALRTLDGSLLGVVQAGPLGDDARPDGLATALGAVRVPLALVVERARREESLRLRLAAANAQLEAGQRLAGSALSFERFVGLLLELALKSTRTEAGFVAVVDPASGRLAVRVGSGMPDGFVSDVDLSPETGLFDWSPAAYGGALILRDLDTAVRLGIRSLLAVPLAEADNPLGVVALVNFDEGGTFDEQSLELLETYAEQIRLMLHNARLFDSFAERYLETVKGLARSLDARRSHTRDHHEHISETAGAIADALSVAAPEAHAIRTAGLIHDVGLAASAGDAAALDADMEHPSVGAGLIEHLPLHPAVAASVATHHEWFDGWGFPAGLSEDDIPLGGRILAISEFLVEMAAGEAVRAPWPTERLVTEVRRRRGSQFDPRVADAAVALLEREALSLADDDPHPDEETS